MTTRQTPGRIAVIAGAIVFAGSAAYWTWEYVLPALSWSPDGLDTFAIIGEVFLDSLWNACIVMMVVFGVACRVESHRRRAAAAVEARP